LTAKIVIASTLKPVWDTRAYEKFAKSLIKTKKYAVEIIGSGTLSNPETGISINPHPYSRNLAERLLRPLIILRKLLKSNPELLIITTHELVLTAVLYKVLTGSKIIYDIQENYKFNLHYQGIYPSPFNKILAHYIRFKEVLSQPFFNYYFLAEKCYVDQMKFIRKRANKYLVLENKSIAPLRHPVPVADQKTTLLLSGTISELYGATDAITYFESLPPNQFNLIIAGHCPNVDLRNKLKEEAARLPGIKLLISDEPIPHEQLVSLYTKNTIGLLPYRLHKSTQNKLPTKLFEYLVHGIPVLISTNPIWKNFIKDYPGITEIDFSQPANIDHISNCIALRDKLNSTDLQLLKWFSVENYFLDQIDNVLRN